MSALTQLSQQLSQLSDSLKATNNLIARLSKLTFQPGSEPLDGAGSVRVELAQDIHESLKQLDEDLELLKQEVDDLSSNSSGYSRRRDTEQDRERARLNAQVVRLGEDLRHSRSHFRRAQLNAKKASEAAKQKERELVFASLQQPPPDTTEQLTNDDNISTPDLFAGRRKLATQQKNLTKEELEVDASSNVTAALRRTHDLLSTELSRSRFAQETFDQSTAALNELGEKYTDLNTLLSSSWNLLGTLVKSQKSDTWYLETAFYFLLGTLIYLVFRRILLGPLYQLPLFLFRWFIWPPLYLFLTITGVITTDPASTSSVRSITTTRTPLIVQPSATGGVPRFADNMAEMPKRGIPVGAGGSQAKGGGDPVLEGEMSERIGKMAEDSAKQGTGAEEEDKDLPRRADGTILKERTDEPRNPKKKMFEADVEDQKHEEAQQRRKRDEL